MVVGRSVARSLWLFRLQTPSAPVSKMPSCIINKCLSKSGKKGQDEDIQLHRFPKDLARITLWLHSMKQTFEDLPGLAQRILEGTLQNKYRICSLHFSKESYIIDTNGRTLRSEAVPTIFPLVEEGEKTIQENLQKIRPLTRKRPLEKKTTVMVSEGNVPSAVEDISEQHTITNFVNTGTQTELSLLNVVIIVTDGKVIFHDLGEQFKTPGKYTRKPMQSLEKVTTTSSGNKTYLDSPLKKRPHLNIEFPTYEEEITIKEIEPLSPIPYNQDIEENCSEDSAQNVSLSALGSRLQNSKRQAMAEKIETQAKSKVYLDYNATTPPAAEVVDVITEALQEAWGNPSSSYSAGRKAKELIDTARAQIARMVRGKPEDVIFTSGGTEANNMVLLSAVDYFNMSIKKEQSSPLDMALPHIITSNVEHDSIVLPLKHLQRAHRAEVTFVPISTRMGRVEVDDVVAALRPNTCLVSIMLANNETGVLMPISELSLRLAPISKERKAQGLPPVLLHTDAAQALGKISVDVQELGVHYLTIVGHKFYGPRIGALYVHGIEHKTPLLPMLHGGGQERNYRPGTENTPMIAGLGKAAELVSLHCTDYENHMRNVRDYMEERLQTVFGNEIRFNSYFPGTERLPNTCNVSLLRPALLGREWLSHCDYLLASVGAACHSDRGDSPSHVLLSSGVPPEAARGAIRLSVGRDTSREDVDLIVEDLKQAAQRLEKKVTIKVELEN